MRITCPSCSTSYTIADDKIGAKGRSVRCASCGTKWLATADAEAAETPSAMQPKEPDDLRDAWAAVPDDGDSGPDLYRPTTEPVPISALKLDTDRLTAPAVPVPDSAPVRQEAEPATADIDLDAQLAEINKRKDIESYAKKPKIKVSKKKPPRTRKPFKFDMERFLVRARPVFGAFILVLSLGVLGLVVALRTSVVAAFPSLASLYEMAGMPVNLRGLDFVNLQMLREVENAQPVLVVEGELANSTNVERDVPAIRFSLRGDDAQEIYAWSIEPKTTMLTPGATMRFRTRLASPPDQAADIQVRMIDRRNRQAAVHD